MDHKQSSNAISGCSLSFPLALARSRDHSSRHKRLQLSPVTEDGRTPQKSPRSGPELGASQTFVGMSRNKSQRSKRKRNGPQCEPKAAFPSRMNHLNPSDGPGCSPRLPSVAPEHLYIDPECPPMALGSSGGAAEGLTKGSTHTSMHRCCSKLTKS